MVRKCGETTERNADGTFAAGNAGRPRGARNRATLAVEALLDGEAEALTRRAVDMAMAGDATALRLCLERIVPPRKDVPVRFQCPSITSASEAADVAGAALKAMAKGEITPTEASRIMTIVEAFRRTRETSAFERRISALEERA